MKDFWQNDAERLTRKTILNRGLSGSALWAAENSYWFLCLFGLCRLSNWLSFTETLTRKFYWHGAKVLWEGVVFPNGDQLTKSRLSTRNAEAFLKRTRLSLPATKVWLFFLDLSGVQSQFFFKNALTVPRLQALRYPFNCAGDIILGAVSITLLYTRMDKVFRISLLGRQGWEHRKPSPRWRRNKRGVHGAPH